MFEQKVRWLVFCVAIVIRTANGRDLPVGWFDPANFGPSERITLCFDLSVPKPPKAGVVLDLPQEEQVKQHSLLLRFQSSKVDENKGAYLTWGCFGESTLINFISNAGAPTSIGISLVPKPAEIGEGDFFRSDLPGTLYLMEAGLKRRFLYRFAPSERRDSILTALPTESADKIAVRLPIGAEVFESRRGAAIADRNLELATGTVRQYKTEHASPSSAEPIDISYQVQPTSAQKKLFEYGLKFFGVIFVPLIGLLLLTSKEVNERAALRRRVLWAGGVVELAILGILLWWAFRIESVAGLDAILEIVVAVIGAIATASIAFVKGSAAA
jgi:hypothetical protein